jgi:hypothetical protein
MISWVKERDRFRGREKTRRDREGGEGEKERKSI